MTSYNPYKLLYGCEPILPSSIWEKLAFIVDLDDPNIWAECLQEQAQVFQRAMPMAMENLSIALGTVTHCVMHAFAMVFIDLSYGDSGKGIIYISNVRRL